jgi:hypothetical protein
LPHNTEPPAETPAVVGTIRDDRIMAKSEERARRVERRLDRALHDHDLVRLRRRIRGAEKLDGYVLAVARSWLLMALLDNGIRLDGYAALRTADVVGVEPRRTSSFVGKALALQGSWPPVGAAGVDLTDIRSLIGSVAECFSLVTLHLEKADPDVCFIGRPVGFGKSSVRLQEITPEAAWRREPTKWSLREVTRIDFGGAYEHALYAVGGDPPLRTGGRTGHSF